MEILQTVVRFHPYIGGVENYVYNLSLNLSRMGHRVKIICSKEGGYENIPEIEIKKLKYLFKIANTNISPMLLTHLVSEDFDVIHTHLPTPWFSDLSAVASEMKKVPLILTYHNDITSHGIWKAFSYAYNRFLLNNLLVKARKIIVSQSRFYKSPFLRRYRDKITVIPPGVDTYLFRPMKLQKDNAIIFVGKLDRYHDYKNFDALITALKLLKGRVDVKLYVVGSGSMVPEYINMAKNYSVDDRIVFFGDVGEEKLVELYNKSLFLVLPSKSGSQEGFGMVAAEALACATPVVVSGIVGIAGDVVRAGCGLVIKPTVGEISNAIETLASQDLRKMGNKGRRLILKKYSWEVVAKKVERLYTEVLEK